MFSTLDSGSKSLGLSPGWGHCLHSRVRQFTLKVPFSTQGYKCVLANLTLRWTSIPSMGVKILLPAFATETGISSRCMGHLAQQTLSLVYCTYGLLTRHKVRMAGYWPSPFFCVFMERDTVEIHKQVKQMTSRFSHWLKKLGQYRISYMA